MGPFRTPHKTKQFRIFVGVIVAAVVLAPLVQSLLGLPQFSWHTRFFSGGITLLVFIPAGWLAFRFGIVGWLTLAVAMLAFAFWARVHS